MTCEHKRLILIEQRDGKDAAVLYATTTLTIYKKALLQSRKRGFSKPHHASLPEYRRSFIESYLSFKHYLIHGLPADVTYKYVTKTYYLKEQEYTFGEYVAV